MDEIQGLSLSTLIGLLAGMGGGIFFAALLYFFFRIRIRDSAAMKVNQAESRASSILAEAELSAKSEANEIIDKARSTARDIEQKCLDLERSILKQSAIHEAKEEKLNQLKEELSSEKKSLEKQRAEIATMEDKWRSEMEKLTGLNFEEAKKSFIEGVALNAESEAQQIGNAILERAKHQSESEAKKIIASSILRYSGEYTFETTTSTVSLPNTDIKGRIIGREGRNIRAFELATGVTVLIDDTPNAVVLSGFDPVRREIARTAMERLIEDGRIHPTRIEEVVEKSREDIEQVITRAGYEAQQKVQIPAMNQDVTHLLGKLKFRLSYSQNILDHSIEVAHLCGLLAAELGCDVKIAKQCGLLHDIGKAINHEKEGGHAIVGAEFLKQNGLPDEVVNGVASHHLEVEPVGPYGVLVGAADAISAARPGARSESLSTYLHRIEALEKLADSFSGIKKCFAVHAGRELRVLANAEEISDDEATKLARTIARTIEEQIQYPGQIRVTVIRETRCTEIAK